MNDMASRTEDVFGKEVGLMHEVIIAGRKVGADRAFWKTLAHDSALLGKFVKIVELLNKSKGGQVLLQDCLDGLARAAIVAEEEASVEAFTTSHFDKHGRRIPPKGLNASVCDANYDFHVVQLARVDYAERLRLAQEALGADKQVVWPSAEEFRQATEEVLEGLREDEQCANILKGPHFPICIPRMKVVDYGQVLDEMLLPAVGRAYKRAYPNRTFYNHRQGELQGEVEIWAGSRHEQLVQAVQEKPVVGVLFPQALQGFSINADREQMASLPERFSLTGGLDTMCAWLMYASELLRDGKMPVYDMAALIWRGWSLFGDANDDSAEFGDKRNIDFAYGSYGAGLVARR